MEPPASFACADCAAASSSCGDACGDTPRKRLLERVVPDISKISTEKTVNRKDQKATHGVCTHRICGTAAACRLLDRDCCVACEATAELEQPANVAFGSLGPPPRQTWRGGCGSGSYEARHPRSCQACLTGLSVWEKILDTNQGLIRIVIEDTGGAVHNQLTDVYGVRCDPSGGAGARVTHDTRVEMVEVGAQAVDDVDASAVYPADEDEEVPVGVGAQALDHAPETMSAAAGRTLLASLVQFRTAPLDDGVPVMAILRAALALRTTPQVQEVRSAARETSIPTQTHTHPSTLELGMWNQH
jgi:hypothetical protein